MLTHMGPNLVLCAITITRNIAGQELICQRALQRSDNMAAGLGKGRLAALLAGTGGVQRYGWTPAAAGEDLRIIFTRPYLYGFTPR